MDSVARRAWWRRFKESLSSVHPWIERSEHYTIAVLAIIKLPLVFFFVILIIFGVAAAWNLPTPLTMVAAVIHTETLVVTIDDANLARFHLAHARLGTPTGRCLEDVNVEPKSGTQIGYTMPIGEPLTVSVAGDFTWGARGMPMHQADAAYFVMDRNSKGCRPGSSVRLPIAGALDVGAYAGPETTLKPILNGTLTVYGRAVDHVLMFSLKGMPLMEPGKFYLAESFTIPAGSLLQGRGPVTAAAQSECPIADRVSPDQSWRGFTDAGLGISTDTDRGLQLDAATNASNLLLMAPVIPMHESQCPDVISLTLGARLSGDPNLRWLFALATGGLVLVSIVLQLITLTVTRQELEKN